MPFVSPAPSGRAHPNALPLLLLGLALLGLPSPARSEEPLKLTDGDRVVLIGSTLIEREQRDGYWETALIRRFPGKSIQVRNLGWSGDTVFADSWAGFDTPVEGVRRRTEHIKSLKPTVLIVGYGTNESFAGEAGLPRFVEGLNRLLDAVVSEKTQLVLVSPLVQENKGPPRRNRDLRLYSNAIRDTAKKRGARFVDLWPGGWRSAPLTDNGIHLTPLGYWVMAQHLMPMLGLEGFLMEEIELDAGGKRPKQPGIQVKRVLQTGDSKDHLRVEVTEAFVPLSPTLGDEPNPEPLAREFKVHALPKGTYTLWIDGKEIATAASQKWDEGVAIAHAPELEQAEKLRQAIIRKNRLYFYRWRPQNVTYLFGFRKHEQGQNAREIPQFDPLVAREEAEIARLSVPRTHVYELKPATR